MSKVITVVSGITAAYAAASVAIRMMSDAQISADRKANSTEIVNRLAGTGTDKSRIAPALDDTFKGITNHNAERFTQVNDFESAFKRIYQPNQADNLNDFMSDAFMVKENGGGQKARQAFGQMDKALADLAASGATKDATATFAEMQKKVKAAGGSVEDLIKLVPNYRDQMLNLATQNGLTNLTEEEKAAVLAGTSSQMDRAAMSAEAMAEKEKFVAAATEKQSEALAELGVNIDGTIASLATFTEFLVGAGLLQLSSRDATASYEEAVDGLDQKIKDIMATEQAHGGVLNEMRTDLDLSSEAGRAANAVFADLAVKGINSAVAMAKAGDSQEVIQGRLKDTYTNMVETAKGFGLTDDAAVALTRSVLKVPEGVSIDSWMADKARIEAEKAKAAMDAIDGRVVKTYAEHRETTFVETVRSDSVQNNSGTNNDGARKAYASGGPVYGPGMKGVDSVRTLLAPGEHVFTADEVDKMGGQSAVYAMRAAIRSGAAYSAPPAPVAAVATAGSTAAPDVRVYIGNEQIDARIEYVSAGVVSRADQKSAYTRRGRQ
jgi:hypothetical protein